MVSVLLRQINFLFAVMSIIKHYIPSAEIYHEVDYYKDEFDDGVRLARVINSKINNPYRKTDKISQTDFTDYIEELCIAIKEH